MSTGERPARRARVARLAALIGALALAVAGGCAAKGADGASGSGQVGEGKGRLPLERCTVEGLRSPAMCGTFRVPEDRSRAGGRTIDLRVVVVPALASAPSPDPVLVFAGGPGQAATQIAGFALFAGDRLHDKRDFVFVDQRGTGASNGLFCEATPDDAPLAEHFDSEFDADAVVRCRESQDADLRQYTTAIAMEDLDAVREALGYAKINLWGTSYGTRAALAYLRAHGDHVRSVVLDSVAPMSLFLPLSLAKDGERALGLLFDDCAAEPGCARAFPDLRARFTTFLAGLEDEPIRARVRHPITGAPEDVVIDRAAFTGALRSLLYAPELASLVPLALDRAMSGELGPFVALARELAGGLSRTMATGMFLSVVCSEDVPFFRPEDVVREATGTFLGPSSALEIVRACSFWPRAEVPKSFRDPVESDVPVLLLSGAFDPVTPPAWAEEAKKTLHRSTAVVFGGTAHTAATTACARKIAATFVEAGSEKDLDTACAAKLPRPAFFTSFAGAP